MRRRIFCRGMILIGLLLAALVLDHYFGLPPRGPRFRLRSASAWSSAITGGETVFGYPVDETGSHVTRYLPDDGTPPFYFRRLRSLILGEKCYGRALKQVSVGPDGMLYSGRDVDPAAAPVLIVLKGSRAERLYAAFTMGTLGPRAESAIPALIEIRESDDPKTRQIATEALQPIAPDSFRAD